MKKEMPVKSETPIYQCCICEEESYEFQVCCGHPMMDIQDWNVMAVGLKK